jgi:hypothetical protein
VNANTVFNMVFDAMTAYNQIGFMLGGLVCLGLGGALIGYYVYEHMTGRKVRGRIAAIRCEGFKDVPNVSGGKWNYPYTGEMYHAIYEYTAPDGKLMRSEDNTGCGSLAGMAPGTSVWLYMNPAHPEKIMRSGPLWLIIGLVFAAPGALFLYFAFSLYAFNIFSLIFFIGLLAMGAIKLKRTLTPEKMKIAREAFMARKAAEQGPKAGRELTADEIRVRLRATQSYSGQIGAVCGLFGVAIFALGIYLGHNIQGLLAVGQRAPGEVVGLESSRSSDSSTYHAVVDFDIPGGGRLEFRDSVGSNPPTHRSGDKVTVLYDPDHPEHAIIDRGVWNWAPCGGCIAGGAFLVLIALKTQANARRAKRL